MDVDGITALEMSHILGVSSDGVKRRLQRKGIRPFKYIGPVGLYKNADLEAIKDGGIRGRPKAKPPEPTTKKTKAKTTKNLRVHFFTICLA
jgi:hypothetical protein